MVSRGAQPAWAPPNFARGLFRGVLRWTGWWNWTSLGGGEHYDSWAHGVTVKLVDFSPVFLSRFGCCLICDSGLEALAWGMVAEKVMNWIWYISFFFWEMEWGRKPMFLKIRARREAREYGRWELLWNNVDSLILLINEFYCNFLGLRFHMT
jgi:hypothetical protein